MITNVELSAIIDNSTFVIRKKHDIAKIAFLNTS